MKALSPRSRRLFAVAAGAALVLLIAVAVVHVVPRPPRALSAAEVTGTWSSDTLTGEITLSENGHLTITDLGIALTDAFGTDSDFDAIGTWTLSDEPGTVSVVLTSATINGEEQSMRTYSSSLQFSMRTAAPQLFVMDFNDEQPYYFTRGDP